MKALLILACSATKRPEPAPLPALERYNGPAWRVLRRALRTREGLVDRLDVFALSAAHGLIGSAAPIAAYDLRMTAERAAELRPEVARGLDRLSGTPYTAAFVNVGSVYRYALPGPLPWPATFAAGGIGERLHQLKEWLHGL